MTDEKSNWVESRWSRGGINIHKSTSIRGRAYPRTILSKYQSKDHDFHITLFAYQFLRIILFVPFI